MRQLEERRKKPVNIILADDHPFVRSGIRQTLELNERIKVVGEAGDGEEAIKVILNNSVDIVLIDISMPKYDGIQVMGKVLKTKADTKFIFVTAYEESHYAHRLIKLGASGYINKSEPSDRVIDAINTVSQGSKFFSNSVINRLIETAGSRRKPSHGHDCLSEREFEVLRLMGTRKSSTEVAEALHISPKTVSVHIANMVKKLDLINQADLVHYAIKNSLFN